MKLFLTFSLFGLSVFFLSCTSLKPNAKKANLRLKLVESLNLKQLGRNKVRRIFGKPGKIEHLETEGDYQGPNGEVWLYADDRVAPRLKVFFEPRSKTASWLQWRFEDEDPQPDVFIVKKRYPEALWRPRAPANAGRDDLPDNCYLMDTKNGTFIEFARSNGLVSFIAWGNAPARKPASTKETSFNKGQVCVGGKCFEYSKELENRDLCDPTGEWIGQ